MLAELGKPETGRRNAAIRLADWLEEYGDIRADHVRDIVRVNHEDGVYDILSLFDVNYCECVLMESEEGCELCHGTGWIMNKVPLV